MLRCHAKRQYEGLADTEDGGIANAVRRAVYRKLNNDPEPEPESKSNCGAAVKDDLVYKTGKLVFPVIIVKDDNFVGQRPVINLKDDSLVGQRNAQQDTNNDILLDHGDPDDNSYPLGLGQSQISFEPVTPLSRRVPREPEMHDTPTVESPPQFKCSLVSSSSDKVINLDLDE